MILSMAKITRDYENEDIYTAVKRHRDFPNSAGDFHNYNADLMEIDVRPTKTGGHVVTVTTTYEFSGSDLPDLIDTILEEHKKYSR